MNYTRVLCSFVFAVVILNGATFVLFPFLSLFWSIFYIILFHCGAIWTQSLPTFRHDNDKIFNGLISARRWFKRFCMFSTLQKLLFSLFGLCDGEWKVLLQLAHQSISINSLCVSFEWNSGVAVVPSVCADDTRLNAFIMRLDIVLCSHLMHKMNAALNGVTVC